MILDAALAVKICVTSFPEVCCSVGVLLETILLARDNKKHFGLKKFSSVLLGTIDNYRSTQLWSLEIHTDNLNLLSGTEADCLVCPTHIAKLSWPSE